MELHNFLKLTRNGCPQTWILLFLCLIFFDLCRLMEEITHQLWWCLLHYFKRLIHPGVFTWIFFYQHEALLQLLAIKEEEVQVPQEKKKEQVMRVSAWGGKNIHFFDVFPPWITTVANIPWKLMVGRWFISFPCKHDTFLRGHSFIFWCQGYLCFWPMAPDEICRFFLVPPEFSSSVPPPPSTSY